MVSRLTVPGKSTRRQPPSPTQSPLTDDPQWDQSPSAPSNAQGKFEEYGRAPLRAFQHPSSKLGFESAQPETLKVLDLFLATRCHFICSRNSGFKFLNMAEALKQALRSAGFSWSNEALDLVVSHLLQEEIRELRALRGEKPAADTLPLRLLNFRLVARLRDRRLR